MEPVELLELKQQPLEKWIVGMGGGQSPYIYSLNDQGTNEWILSIQGGGQGGVSLVERNRIAELMWKSPELLAIATELMSHVSGGPLLVEHAEAIWTKHGIQPPAAAEGRDGE